MTEGVIMNLSVRINEDSNLKVLEVSGEIDATQHLSLRNH